MKYLFLMMSLGFSVAACSQTDTTTYGYVHGKYVQAEIGAIFLGGDMVWKNYLRTTLRQQNTAGVVTVEFTVDL